jgi:hypothetical protein
VLITFSAGATCSLPTSPGTTRSSGRPAMYLAKRAGKNA